MQVDPGVFNNKTKSIGSDGSAGSVGSAYLNSDEFDEDGSDDDSDTMADGSFEINTKGGLPQASDMAKRITLTSHNTEQQQPTIDCGLCGDRHGSGECPMVDHSENLAEYREMLILHADDEPWEERVRFFDSSFKCMSLNTVSSTTCLLLERSYSCDRRNTLPARGHCPYSWPAPPPIGQGIAWCLDFQVQGFNCEFAGRFIQTGVLISTWEAEEKGQNGDGANPPLSV